MEPTNPDFVPVHLRPVLRPKDVAALIGCHVNTIYRLIKEGRLRTFTLWRGGSYLIRMEDLDAFIAERANVDAA